MREIFVESESEKFPLPPGFVGAGGVTSVGEPLQGGRSRGRPFYMHRLLAPDDLTQEDLFVYRNWKTRRCYPDPRHPDSPLWWVVEGEPERFLVIDGERHRAHVDQLPPRRLLDLPDEATLRLPLPEQATRGGFPERLNPPTEDVAENTGEESAWRELLWSEEEPRSAEASAPSVSVAVADAGCDPFKRSLSAALAELTAPVCANLERQTRVPVRVVLPNVDDDGDTPVSLPTRPELISGDFLSHEAPRPALTPIEILKPAARSRIPGRTFAVITGMLVLFVGLALWLFH